VDIHTIYHVSRLVRLTFPFSQNLTKLSSSIPANRNMRRRFFGGRG
jgi:hypothetical protein